MARSPGAAESLDRFGITPTVAVLREDDRGGLIAYLTLWQICHRVRRPSGQHAVASLLLKPLFDISGH